MRDRGTTPPTLHPRATRARNAWDLRQVLAKHVFSHLYALKDGSLHLRDLANFERSQYLAPDEIFELQWQARKEIVRYAYESCPYYREKYYAADFHPDDLREPEDWLHIPPIGKEEIQDYNEDLVSRDLRDDEIIPNFTGGSTGKPLPLFVTERRMQSRCAGMMRHDRWAGWDIGAPLACLWGAARDLDGLGRFKARLRNALVDRVLYLDASMMTRDTMREFATRLARKPPFFFLAYAGCMALFARYVRETSFAGRIGARAIISSAEVLTEEDRALMESTFECKVFNRYGCREASVLASECEEHDGLHINAESVHLEFCRGSSPVKPGELGEVLLTDLHNIALPLIRYRIGDVGEPSEAVCRCGRGLPMMRMAAGRTTDFLVAHDGSLVSGIVLATYVVTRIEGVAQVQFRQLAKDHLQVRLVLRDGDMASVAARTRALLVPYLGAGTALEFEFVESIEKESSGKFRFSISELDPLEFVT